MEQQTLDQDAWLDLLCKGSRSDARLPMLSGSMAPVLLPGDTITVHPEHWKRVHTGDIVVFKSEKRLVAHRVIFAARLGRLALMLEKGDANSSPSLVSKDAVVGIVVSAERDGRMVYRHSPGSRQEGRRMARRAVRRLILHDIPRNMARRMIGREV